MGSSCLYRCDLGWTVGFWFGFGESRFQEYEYSYSTWVSTPTPIDKLRTEPGQRNFTPQRCSGQVPLEPLKESINNELAQVAIRQMSTGSGVLFDMIW
jgi:hypothetical protein